MHKKLKITILGCGASTGVPAIGRKWGKCNPHNPRNRRGRCSILLSCCEQKILVDTSSDAREQFLNHNINHLDGVVFTHSHADHTHGINELRSLYLYNKKIIPIYSDQETLRSLRQSFGYLFPQNNNNLKNHNHCLTYNLIDTYIQFNGWEIKFFEQDHGSSKSLGLRIGDFAYSTDVKRLPDESLNQLKNLKVWIVGCMSRDLNYSHAHLDQILEWVKLIKPQRTILTHMDFTMDYDTLCQELPKGVEPGYDGMIINIPLKDVSNPKI